MTKSISIVFSLTLLFELVSVTRADSLVVPQSDTSVEGGGNNIFPFDAGVLTANGTRYQQVYAASEFAPLTTPIEISQIAFRPDGTHGAPGSVTIASIQIDLSTTASPPDALDPTFAANVGADDVTVFPQGPLTLSSSFTGPPGGPKDFDVVINLTTPFVYNPANGNLLLDVRNFSSENFGFFTPVTLDSDNSFADGVSRQLSEDVNSDQILLADSVGLVTKFTFAPVIEPSPGDYNKDGHVNAADINALQLALTNLALYKSTYDVSDSDLAIINQLPGESTTDLNNSDLQALLDYLNTGGGSATPVPEPSTLALLALGALGLLTRRKFARSVIPR